ncbi:hypothetical protein RCO28_34465 [Streptomyces sp. LHD-70]|uniref:hypothetical protein n=1 Tax=Streptomyces sp. LHD-70 TaxID=3072140 RepID=UPI00280F4EBD|nr:hypothetical protein [Streptomyces sp. LHD-70]MDQ8707537.1 hypothetical protein [Streptomyces sp. LHD-70]
MNKRVSAAITAITATAALATLTTTTTEAAAAEQTCGSLIPDGWETCEQELRADENGQLVPVYKATWANGDVMVRPANAEPRTITGESYEVRQGQRVKVTDYSDGSQKVRPASLPVKPEAKPESQAQPAVPAPSTGEGGMRPVTGGQGLSLRDANGTRTGSGLSDNDRAEFIACGPGGLVQIRQTTSGRGGWGTLREGYATGTAITGHNCGGAR